MLPIRVQLDPEKHGYEYCPKCDGRGEVKFYRGAVWICPTCNGDGLVRSDNLGETTFYSE